MKQLILVDDDPSILDILIMIFSRAGFAVTSYSNADALLNGTFSIPDAIVLDRQLSGTDGLDVCRFLKSKTDTQHIPIIMVSANFNISTLAQQAGADDFVEKPFKINHLLEVVEKHVSRPV